MRKPEKGTNIAIEKVDRCEYANFCRLILILQKEINNNNGKSSA